MGFSGVYRETSWKVDFDDISLDREGSIYVQEISASNTSIKDFDITFVRPGDGFTIKLDVVHDFNYIYEIISSTFDIDLLKYGHSNVLSIL